MSGIFKKNDIRGIFGEQLSEDIAYRVASSLTKFYHTNGKKLENIAIAGDSRLSTPILREAMTRGFKENGTNVYNLGLGPSPMIYHTAVANTEIDAGIIITASHNPQEYNGIKICDSDGVAFHYDNLYGWIENHLEEKIETEKKGLEYDGKKYRLQYYEQIISKTKLENSLKIVIEIGNGSTGDIVPYLEAIGCDVVPLNKNPDGNFPIMLPDPSKSYTYDGISIELSKSDYSLGIAFDGDGDRVGFMTSNGNIISPDTVIMLLSEEILKKKSGKIIIDVKVSKATADYIKEKGGNPILSRVGHSWIHERIIEEDALFAGELSGHYYFNDEYFGFDDGLYSAIRFLQVLDGLISQNINLSNYVKALPSFYPTQEFRVSIPQKRQNKILEKIKQYTHDNNGKLITIDGIRGEFDDGWYIARSSSTEDKLSYRIEGKSETTRDQLLSDIQKIITEN